jgi:hypothetical protein
VNPSSDSFYQTTAKKTAIFDCEHHVKPADETLGEPLTAHGCSHWSFSSGEDLPSLALPAFITDPA